MVPVYGKLAYPGGGGSIGWSLSWTAAPPLDFPVTADMCKRNARQEPDPSPIDDLWQLWIQAAVGFLEAETRRLIWSRQVTITYDNWPQGDAELVIPVEPVQEVNGIAYTAPDGTPATLVWQTDFDKWLDGNPPVVWPLAAWPDRAARSPVFVAATVGYAAAAQVPAQIRQAVLILTAIFESNPTLVDRNGDVTSLRAVRSLATSAGVGAYP